jgi:hypothetical protein
MLENLELSMVNGSPTIQMKHLLVGRDYTPQQSIDLGKWKEIDAFTASAGTNSWSGLMPNPTAAYFRLQWQR